jgi:hypothetical protein
MGSRQYIIPTDSMTLTDQKEYRTKALAAGISRAFLKNVGSAADIPNSADPNSVFAYLMAGGIWPPSLDVRDFQPILDAGCALDQWLTAALAAVGTAYSCLQAVATAPVALRNNKLLVIYKVAVVTAGFPVSRLIFRTAVAGNFIAQFDLEPLINQRTPEGYLSEPVVIDPNITFAAQVLASAATGAAAKVVLGNFLFEPSGQTNA